MTEARKTVWLELPDFRVVPLKSWLTKHVAALQRTIHHGTEAYPDSARQNFFDIQLDAGWVYVHMHAASRVVYLVAHSVLRTESTALKLAPVLLSENGTGQDSDRPHAAEIDLLALILSRTLHDEPNFTFVLPDEQQRRVVLPWFFRTLAIRASQLWGEIYTTESVDGGALWIRVRLAHTFGRVLRTGMLTSPFRLGWASLRRCMSLSGRLEVVHKSVARGPHWYLMALGVEPSVTGQAIAGALIEPVLSRADLDALPCYLETFNESSLSFYKKRGFRIAGAGRIPRGGPNFWALLRDPES